MRFLRSRSFTAAVIVACALATGGVAGERPMARSDASPAQPSLEMVVGDYQASAQIIQIRLREDGVLTIAVDVRDH